MEVNVIEKNNDPASVPVVIIFHGHNSLCGRCNHFYCSTGQPHDRGECGWCRSTVRRRARNSFYGGAAFLPDVFDSFRKR